MGSNPNAMTIQKTYLSWQGKKQKSSLTPTDIGGIYEQA